MSLKEYAEKRNFNQTPEPGPSGALASPGAPHFYVQRHDASRLHYDFRLEIDGTLKSWAIPKGPTLDPAPKRLAAMVEDHPLEYGEFEGNIPKGQYGGGSVMLWDRGTFELLGDLTALKQIERGDLKFRLQGEKLAGEFAIVLMKGRGKGNEWLLLKKRDSFARPGWDVEEHAVSVKTGRTQEEIAKDLPAKKAAPAPEPKPSAKRRKKTAALPPLPTDVAPMMATLAQKPPRGSDWLFEIKWDGVRGLCFIENSELRIVTRNGNRCERQYPELSVLPHYVDAEQAILDGEIAVLDERGVSSFPLIQPRIMNQDANSVAHMARKTPVHLFLFDLLWLDGEDWRGRPLSERKEQLAKIVKEHPLIKVSNAFQGSGEEILEAARQYGLEGVVAKRAGSFYEPKRSQDWLKLKLVTEEDFVICGFLKKKREYFGSLILGGYDEGKLRHVGQVGTGFDNRMIEQLYRKLEPLVTDKCPFGPEPKIAGGGEVVWVRPELVAKVKFLCWTKDHILRAPVFLGLREDIDPPGPSPAPEEVQAPLGLSGTEAMVEVDGQRLKFTNLKKVLFPKDGYTKRDLISYYDSVAAWILPHLKDRPLSLKRYPNGIHEPYFFQKDSPSSFPDWLRFETIDDIRYVLAEDRAALLYLANLACIDHNPYQSRAGSIENPDWILIDLDPQECSFDRIVEAALLVRKKLDILELEGYPKTTGGDGLHIYIPVVADYSYEQTKSFAEVIARTLAGEHPDLFTTPRSVSKRQKNRVYFDYLQNGMGKTIAAPYVVRAHDGAPVATPLRWDEVKLGLYPSQFTIRNAPQRFESLGDLFADVLRKPQSLDGAVGRFEKLVAK